MTYVVAIYLVMVHLNGDVGKEERQAFWQVQIRIDLKPVSFIKI